jgi:general secretion pathway protein G
VGGFTIVELLAVMVIIMMLVAIVVGVVRYADNASQVSVAKAEIERLHAAIETYELEVGNVPEVDIFYSDDFRNVLRRKVSSTDPWGHVYAYTNISTHGYRLYSLGPDGERDTPDDVYPGE